MKGFYLEVVWSHSLRLLFVFVLFLNYFCFARESCGASFDESLTAVSSGLPMGADVAAMGGICTLEDFSSANPAVTSISSGATRSGTINYGNFQFKKNMLEVVSGSVASSVGDVVLQLSFAHGETPLRFLSSEELFRIKRSDTLDFQFGGNVFHGLLLDGDEVYLGMGYSFNKSVQDGITFAATSRNEFVVDSSSHGVTIGFAYKPIKQVTIGGFGSRIWTNSTSIDDGWQNSEISSFHSIGHLGISAKIIEGTTLAFDYQSLSFSDSDTKFDQYFLGIEQYLIRDHVAVYGGLANGGLTTGIGLYFKNGGLNLSYGNNIAKETKEFFGSCDAYMASVYLNF
ncbi:MAG: hypothetical protein WCI36_02685 [bacterium]